MSKSTYQIYVSLIRETGYDELKIDSYNLESIKSLRQSIFGLTMILGQPYLYSVVREGFMSESVFNRLFTLKTGLSMSVSSLDTLKKIMLYYSSFSSQDQFPNKERIEQFVSNQIESWNTLFKDMERESIGEVNET